MDSLYQRKSSSYAIFFILNPILILLFQNCSLKPHLANAVPSATARQVASQAPPVQCRYLASNNCAE